MMTFAPKSSPEISFVKSAPVSDTAIIAVFDDKKLPKETKKQDSANGGMIQHQLDAHTKFKGENGKILTITLPPEAPYTRMIIVGLGPKSKMTTESLETAGGNLASILSAAGSVNAVFLGADELRTKTHNPLLSVLTGLLLGSYNFNDFKTVEKNKKTSSLKRLAVITTAAKTWEKEFEPQASLVESIFLTRDLVNAPPNKLYPDSFAELIKKTLTPLGVKVHVYDDKALEKMGAGCMMAVGQASENLPRLAIMSWEGAGSAKQKAQKPLAFVGKGITFDSGGLNVKPFEGMMDMKMDMGGAATVVGLMRTLAARKCKVPVVAAVALAENAISDEATRPSDIVTSLSGKTVEILNTDAEGRLVLCDALTYIQKKHDPSLIVDLATLTGAIMIALGLNHAGVFANDEKLWKGLEKAAHATGEKVWRMPLDDAFRREMDSEFADIKNIGGGRYGGSCTAAAFLGEFIDEGRIWAHIDIAGVAMSKTKSTCPVPFASGYGVKLLNKLVEDYYE
ncbi:MAG TPA: leucyl aminopeptidase [Alphaproteobacteria bacterium]|nr:leucyl aminopeptidase [Alphaproteobacteria bacterium]HNS43673.1 leucyl aminopeptidase [Alphaproteobacteria bacterium]